MATVAMLGRLLVSLAFVLGLMWLLARRVKRPTKANGKLVDVLSRQQLTRTASVAVVRVGEQALILGVTDGQVSVLGEADLGQIQAQLETQIPVRPTRRAARLSATDPAALTVASLSSATLPTVNRTVPKPAVTSAPGRHSAAAESRPEVHPEVHPDVVASVTKPESRKALSGSALSPDTWRQTIDALRDLTVRSK